MHWCKINASQAFSFVYSCELVCIIHAGLWSDHLSLSIVSLTLILFCPLRSSHSRSGHLYPGSSAPAEPRAPAVSPELPLRSPSDPEPTGPSAAAADPDSHTHTRTHTHSHTARHQRTQSHAASGEYRSLSIWCTHYHTEHDLNCSLNLH